jgi:hypothetical protein
MGNDIYFILMGICLINLLDVVFFYIEKLSDNWLLVFFLGLFVSNIVNI